MAGPASASGLFVGLGALVVLLASMPTMSEAEGLEPRRALTLSLSSAQLRDLVFSESSARKGRWWTRFTHALVHADTRHLLGNLHGLVVSAISVQRAFGAPALWTVFWGGCAVGTMDAGGLKKMHVRSNAEALLTPGFLRSSDGLLRAGLRQGARLIAPVILHCTKYMGCSGGVRALLGVDVCLAVEAVWGFLSPGTASGPRDGPRDGPGELRFGASEPDATGTLRCVALVSNVASPLVASYYALGELVTMHENQALGRHSSTDHAAHLFGFGFGVACFAALRLGPALVSSLARPRKKGG